jgi:hypothetical protein
MNYHSALIFIFLACIQLQGLSQNFNRPVPQDLYEYEFNRYDQTDLASYYLCAPFYNNGGPTTTKAMMLLDQDGYLVWWAKADKQFFDFKYHENHNVFTYTKRSGPLKKHFIMDTLFQIIDSIHVPSGRADIHEFLIFPNGNFCFLGTEDSTMDLSSYSINGVQGDPDTDVSNLIIWEYDANHNFVNRWSALEHIPVDIYAEGFGFPTGNLSFDFVHGNSIELDVDGDLIISMRHANAIYKIDYNTGDIIWRWGGEENEFTFLNDIGFAGQHDARRLPNGNISVFDNQHGTSVGSRCLEYELNTIDSTALLVKEYNYNGTLNCYSLGNYRQLDNGYEIVGWGNTRRPEPSFTL